MGGRHVTCNVSNFTGTHLTNPQSDIKHGKMYEGPPDPIKYTGTFACSARDGAMIGPEGSLTYDCGKLGKVTFYWHHPWGHGTSNYSATVSDATKLSAEAVPSTQTGHDQTIGYNVYKIE